MKIIITVLALFMISCSSVVKSPENINGNIFPSVRGTSLDGKQIKIPDDFKGTNTLILIGYLQKAQFDIDRWILGSLQAELPVRIVEVPTIAGMMPQMVQSFIDNGMRSGIPKNDWASVITVYEDAEKIIKAFGNERPQSALAVLIDKQGKVVWTSNLGYSAGQILNLKSIVPSEGDGKL